MRKLKITEMNRLTPEAFRESKKIPLIVVLDHVRSLNNVGSVFRTSDAFRVEAIYLCGITARPPHPEIHKTALGAEESVDWIYFEDTHLAVDKLKNEGYEVVFNNFDIPGMVQRFDNNDLQPQVFTIGLKKVAQIEPNLKIVRDKSEATIIK